MEYSIYNIKYETSVIAYPVATVSDKDGKSAEQRLEKHLIENDDMGGEHLNFKIHEIIDTGIKASAPGVLNCPMSGKKSS